VVYLLLIACRNVENLFLARLPERRVLCCAVADTSLGLDVPMTWGTVAV